MSYYAVPLWLLQVRVLLRILHVWGHSDATVTEATAHPVPAQYPHGICNGTPTCSSHIGTVLYETHIAIQRESGSVLVQISLRISAKCSLASKILWGKVFWHPDFAVTRYLLPWPGPDWKIINFVAPPHPHLIVFWPDRSKLLSTPKLTSVRQQHTHQYAL